VRQYPQYLLIYDIHQERDLIEMIVSHSMVYELSEGRIA
jgi:hypothetical protein